MSRRMKREELEGIKKAYHMDLPKVGCYRMGHSATHSCNLNVESLVAEVEACWKSKVGKGKDTSDLLHGLRMVVLELNLAVYQILVRRAGYAVAYAVPVESAGDRVGPLRINGYYPTLRKAVLAELKQMAEELKKVRANDRVKP